MLLQKASTDKPPQIFFQENLAHNFFFISCRTIHFLLQLEPILAIQFRMLAHLLAMPKVEAGDGRDDTDSSWQEIWSKNHEPAVTWKKTPGHLKKNQCGYHCFFLFPPSFTKKDIFFAPPKSLSVKLWQWLFHFEGRSWTSVHRKPGVLNCPPLTLFWGERHLVRLVVLSRVVAMKCGYEIYGMPVKFHSPTEQMDKWVLLSWQMFFFLASCLSFFNVYPNDPQKTCIKMTHDKQLV